MTSSCVSDSCNCPTVIDEPTAKTAPPIANTKRMMPSTIPRMNVSVPLRTLITCSYIKKRPFKSARVRRQPNILWNRVATGLLR